MSNVNRLLKLDYPSMINDFETDLQRIPNYVDVTIIKLSNDVIQKENNININI